MRTILISLAMACLMVAPSFAEEAQSPETASAPTEAASPATTTDAAPEVRNATVEPIICRTVRRTESRLRASRERICGTRSEWELMQDETARAVRSAGSVQRAGDGPR